MAASMGRIAELGWVDQWRLWAVLVESAHAATAKYSIIAVGSLGSKPPFAASATKVR
jgi:hypothetical protein